MGENGGGVVEWVERRLKRNVVEGDWWERVVEREKKAEK